MFEFFTKPKSMLSKFSRKRAVLKSSGSSRKLIDTFSLFLPFFGDENIDKVGKWSDISHRIIKESM